MPEKHIQDTNVKQFNYNDNDGFNARKDKFYHCYESINKIFRDEVGVPRRCKPVKYIEYKPYDGRYSPDFANALFVDTLGNEYDERIYKEVDDNAKQGGKRKSRRTRKSKKSRKGKTRKGKSRNNRRRLKRIAK